MPPDSFVWELTKETINLPLGCLQGGSWGVRACGSARPGNSESDLLDVRDAFARFHAARARLDQHRRLRLERPLDLDVFVDLSARSHTESATTLAKRTNSAAGRQSLWLYAVVCS